MLYLDQNSESNPVLIALLGLNQGYACRPKHNMIIYKMICELRPLLISTL